MTDTRAEVSVLSTKVYDKLDLRPPIKQHVTLVQEREWVLTPNLVINNVYSVGSQTEAGIQLSILTAIGDVAPLSCTGTWPNSKEPILDGGGDFSFEVINIAEENNVVEAPAVGLTQCGPGEGVLDRYSVAVSKTSWNYVSR